MAQLSFSANLSRRIDCPERQIAADSVAALFQQYALEHPAVRDYILDNQGAVRKHVMVVVDDHNLRDRTGLTDALKPHSKVYVYQALSGG
ncbi:MAG: MoaD/ThiS family protein [bacterium]